MSTYGDCNGSEYEFNPYVTTLGCAQSPFISFNPLISKWRKTNARRARCYGDVSRWRRFGSGDAKVTHKHTKHPTTMEAEKRDPGNEVAKTTERTSMIKFVQHSIKTDRFKNTFRQSSKL